MKCFKTNIKGPDSTSAYDERHETRGQMGQGMGRGAARDLLWGYSHRGELHAGADELDVQHGRLVPLERLQHTAAPSHAARTPRTYSD